MQETSGKGTAQRRRMPMTRAAKRRLVALAALAAGLFVCYWSLLPDALFDDPVSRVIEDRDGNLLGARIAEDGQWRFPPMARVPEKFKQAIIQFEDRRFERHAGVDPLAVLRAAIGNLKAGHVVSGASTLTMQVIRLARKGRPRTLPEKVWEALLATRLEWAKSKPEILALYASHAPFGGNVVGLEAAAWRYFGRRPEDLSWAEAATLAVLPNAPALVHPGRNRDSLKDKRDRLLERMLTEGIIDGMTCSLAMDEPLPQQPRPLPDLAPHLLDRVAAGRTGGFRLHTTVDSKLQTQVAAILDRYHRKLVTNGVHNGAALVLDNSSGEVLAYLGNCGDYSGDRGAAVDIIPARRSTGSLLKPFLFAAMLQDGRLLPQMLQTDIPTHFGGYAPKNFSLTYCGALPADQALAGSLNVPAVRQLHGYGADRFLYLLRGLGMTTLDRSAEHYGLALILGGAEGSLWEMAGLYAGMARSLTRFERDGTYRRDHFAQPHYERQPAGDDTTLPDPPCYSAAVIWQTMEALRLVNRPEAQGVWQRFGSARRIAWKTGTSFGFRDAWAIGCTPGYTVAVWIGNADGEGRPGLTGASTAAPVMFEIFSALAPPNTWFARPDGEMVSIEICSRSGYRAGPHCDETRLARVARPGLKTELCPYHQLVHLDETGAWRVHGDCASPSTMTARSWFVLPPGVEWFLRTSGSAYQPLPPFRPDCADMASAQAAEQPMELIYPREPTRLYLPVDLDGSKGAAVFEVAHRDREKRVFWHLDRQYLGSTRYFHQMKLSAARGPHVLALVDEDGRRLEQRFEVISATD